MRSAGRPHLPLYVPFPQTKRSGSFGDVKHRYFTIQYDSMKRECSLHVKDPSKLDTDIIM